jgi:DNA-binding transcriptional LysR family regulator
MRHNLRHLRAFLAVVDTGSVSRAAEMCHVSQPAVTQALARLARVLGFPLFVRSRGALFADETGQLFAARVRRAFSCLDPALSELAPRLVLTATAAQLEALVAVCEAENFTLAAQRLGVAQPTVHRAVAQLEKEVGRSLFARTAYGMVPSRAAHHAARAARLAFAELQQGEADLADMRSLAGASIVAGGMPLSRSVILPQAIASFRRRRPNQPIRIIEGPYAELLGGLRRGEIDFLIGALRDPPPIDDVEQETLFHDVVVIVANRRHPLAGRPSVDLEGLASYPWIVAPRNTPIRAHFDALFGGAGKAPANVVESSSLILMRELLDRSDALGFISGGQALAEIERGLMVRLPFDLAHTRRPIGITTRMGWLPTAAQSAFLAEIRRVSRMSFAAP